MKGNRWTIEEDCRLRSLYPVYSNGTIAILMDRSVSGIIGRAFKLNLRKSDAFRNRQRHTPEKFTKGHTPANKGRKREEYMPAESIRRCQATQFKPGQRPATYKGGTLDRRDNTLYVLRNGKRVALKRWVWEQHFGPIPKGMAICTKDGDPYNCDISNLEMRRVGFNTVDCWARMPPEQRAVRSKAAWETRRRNKYGPAYLENKQSAQLRVLDEETIRRRMTLDCMPNPLEFLTKKI